MDREKTIEFLSCTSFVGIIISLLLYVTFMALQSNYPENSLYDVLSYVALAIMVLISLISLIVHCIGGFSNCQSVTSQTSNTTEPAKTSTERIFTGQTEKYVNPAFVNEGATEILNRCLTDVCEEQSQITMHDINLTVCESQSRDGRVSEKPKISFFQMENERIVINIESAASSNLNFHRASYNSASPSPRLSELQTRESPNPREEQLVWLHEENQQPTNSESTMSSELSFYTASYESANPLSRSSSSRSRDIYTPSSGRRSSLSRGSEISSSFSFRSASVRFDEFGSQSLMVTPDSAYSTGTRTQ